ncbi:RraA family protein [Ensifer sp. ENS06]|uniref:RraA family protein n=1 Tax=Ensifer sp. ENS06 TaxID=2769276 RepID=UPI00177CFB23|nr:RraA family protein [Ensifer sp. ENS06]MBD9627052.1 RraA family protein [Ensifer sp. ENS06]
MNDALLALMLRVDTPTVCNAIEVAQGKRGFNAFTRGTVIASAPSAAPIVGYARTARIAAAAPSIDDPALIRARRRDYYRHMAGSGSPAIAVIEDLDFPNCVGAFWGEINATVHRGLGLKGVLTNGVMRDLGDVPADFPMIAGSIGPSHAFVHVEAIAVPVTVFGMRVMPGDLVHADRHGAVVVPPEVVPKLAASIEKLQATERLILEPARQDGFDLAKFEEAWALFEAART